MPRQKMLLRPKKTLLAPLKQRTVGLCEGDSPHCQHKIPMARLKALPHTTLCINCERQLEKSKSCQGGPSPDNWAHVRDFQSAGEDSRINLSILEMNLSADRGFGFGKRNNDI